MAKNIYIYKNNKEESNEAYNMLCSNLKNNDSFNILDEYSDKADVMVCIGGDGTFLSFVHKLQFPQTPIIGINTGHLGFFQEILPSDIPTALSNIIDNKYTIQNIKPIEATIVTEKASFSRIGINEILVRGYYSHVSHYIVSIDGTIIENFNGDGLLISTPVGSTAYNYSLNGSLVSPDLDVLQITPVAPMNTRPYRSFNSSILLPANKTINIEGTGRSQNGTVYLSFDGRTHDFSNVKNVEIKQSNKEINLIRFEDYDYWKKLSNKLL